MTLITVLSKFAKSIFEVAHILFTFIFKNFITKILSQRSWIIINKKAVRFNHKFILFIKNASLYLNLLPCKAPVGTNLTELSRTWSYIVQHKKFSIKNFFSKYDQILRKLWFGHIC